MIRADGACAPFGFEDYQALVQLYADYGSPVDSGNWDLWPEFFIENCRCRLQPRENFDRGFPLAMFNVGRYQDVVVRTPDGLKFSERQAIYDTEMIPNSIIYPI